MYAVKIELFLWVLVWMRSIDSTVHIAVWDVAKWRVGGVLSIFECPVIVRKSPAVDYWGMLCFQNATVIVA